MLRSRSKKRKESKKLCPKTEEFGRYLSTSPPIVESIFKHLTAKDLCSCAQVCTLWQSMATTEKRRRKNVVWFCKVGLTDEYIAPSHMTNNSSAFTENFEYELETELNCNRVEPALCMAFASTAFMENFSELFPTFSYDLPLEVSKAKVMERIRRRHYLAAVIKTALKPHLPVRCPLTFCVAPGIIGCCADRRPVEVEDGPALSGFFLPKMEGLEVYHFPYFPALPKNRSYEVEDLLPVGATVKCLLVFLTSRGMSFSNKIVQNVLMREKCRLAVGGAIIERTESHSGSIIALCGENVEAASVIIGPHDRKAEVKAKLEKFKEAGLLQNQCFAYMFACVGRGHRLYQEHNVESSIFHSLYPRVPLIGVYGNGEIGITYLPHMPAVHRIVQIGKYKRTLKKYLHSYTTVFVMVSIKT